MTDPEFRTGQCPRCGGPPNDEVPVLSEDIPGATIVTRFCSIECRREHVDHRLETGTAYEAVADQLTDAGMDPTAFDDETIGTDDQDPGGSNRLFGRQDSENENESEGQDENWGNEIAFDSSEETSTDREDRSGDQQ